MTNDEINTIVFLIMRYALFGRDNLNLEELAKLESVDDWEPVLEELKLHAVYGLIYPILDDLEIKDKKVYQDWKDLCLFEQVRWIQVSHEQNSVLALLNNKNIPYVIIKGTAAGIYYPNPRLRCAGDIDILVKREDFKRTAKHLEENGYKLLGDLSKVSHHNEYLKNGEIIELHRWLGGFSESDDKVISLFEKGIDNKIVGQINGYSFHRLPMIMNGLVLLFHFKQHIRTGIGLRHILDWMLFVYQEINDEEWKELSKILDDLKLKKLAITLTAICQKYLGLNRDYPWCYTAEEDLCDDLMRYIMNRGNFGNKNDGNEQMASFWITGKDPKTFFIRLQKGGLSRWRSAKRLKFLRPFAWIYQLGYILRQMYEQKRSLTEMKVLYELGVRQREMIDRLEDR